MGISSLIIIGIVVAIMIYCIIRMAMHGHLTASVILCFVFFVSVLFIMDAFGIMSPQMATGELHDGDRKRAEYVRPKRQDMKKKYLSDEEKYEKKLEKF